MPIGLVGEVLVFVPIVGVLLGFTAFISSIVLEVFAIMAVHRLSGGKAPAAVFLAAGAFVVTCGGVYQILMGLFSILK